MRRIGFGVLMAALLAAPLASSQAAEEGFVYVKEGFLTGNDYRRQTLAQRTAYVMGWHDGVFASVFFGAPEHVQPGTPLAVLSRCTTDMFNNQLEAIFSKWLGEHPEQWHQGANTLMYNAMDKVCHFIPAP